MRARLYNLVEGKKPRREPSGQALRVLQELRADTEPRTAQAIDEAIAKSDSPHKTRQDSLRVTLYYILVFKKQGLVQATEQPVEADEAETDATEVAEGQVEAAE